MHFEQFLAHSEHSINFSCDDDDDDDDDDDNNSDDFKNERVFLR